MKSLCKYFLIQNKKEQFYKVIRPTVLLLKFWGFFPFSNSFHGNGKNLTFKTCNSQLVINLFFYGMNIIILVVFAVIRMDMYSRIVVGCLMLSLIIVSHFTDQYIVETIQSIEEYDLSYNKSQNVKEFLRYRYRGLIWFIFNLSNYFLKFGVAIHMLNIENINIEEVVINLNNTIAEGPWHVLFGGIYIQLCYEIALRFLELRKSLERILMKSNFGQKNDIVLEEIRILHGKLTNITDIFNSGFGLRLALYLLKLIILFLSKVYLFVFNNIPLTWGSFFSELFNFIVAFFISYCSELMLLQVSASIVNLSKWFLVDNHCTQFCPFSKRN